MYLKIRTNIQDSVHHIRVNERTLYCTCLLKNSAGVNIRNNVFKKRFLKELWLRI